MATSDEGSKAEVRDESGLCRSGSSSAARTLNSRIDALGADHREIIELLVEKGEGGARKYGLLDLATDARDFEAEARAELVDCVSYLGAKVVELKRENARLRVECGLAELRKAPAVIKRPAVDLAFDMTDADLGGEGG